MSLQRAQFEITSTEFVNWIAYLDDEEENRFHREDYYLAQIAAEIRRSYVKDPRSVKIESFLMKFERKVKPKKSKMTMKERTKKAKAYWSALMGVPKRKK